MAQRDFDQLGDLQSSVMELLWDLGEATVRQVQESLPQPAPAYTTVLTVMQKLDKAGWLSHRAEGRTYIYIPTRSRDEAGSSVLKRIVGHVFGGDRMLALQHLIDTEPLDADDLTAIQKLIDRKRKEADDA